MTPYEKTEILRYPQVWFVGPQARKIQAAEGKGPNMGYDDDKGRYKCIKADHLAYRFEVLKGLGKGSFGDVVKTFDHKTKKHQAVKIIRNERRFHKQAQVEVRVLEMLKRQDRKGNHNLIHINDWFLFRNHLCITFDLMHSDLYSALKSNDFKGFTLRQVHTFAGSLLNCLRLLRRNRVIHCDLKPENILLERKGSDSVKVIDFGSACLDHQKVHSYIQSRFYRSPEVILGAGYSMAIDMWSLGCILVELLHGHPIFPGRDEKQQLMYQMELLGTPPPEFISRGKRSPSFFAADGAPLHLTDHKGRTRAPATKTWERALGTRDPGFTDFIKGCLKWDPAERMTPKQATKHPWLMGTNTTTARSRRSSSSSSTSGAVSAASSRRTSASARSRHNSQISEGGVVSSSGMSAAAAAAAAAASPLKPCPPIFSHVVQLPAQPSTSIASSHELGKSQRSG